MSAILAVFVKNLLLKCRYPSCFSWSQGYEGLHCGHVHDFSLTVFCMRCLCMIMMYFFVRFYMRSSDGSLFTAIKPNTVGSFPFNDRHVILHCEN